jgi:hypothetical protein
MQRMNQSLVDRDQSGRIIPGSWRDVSVLNSAENLAGNSSGAIPNAIRDKYKDYFNGVGSVPWQAEAIANGNF